MKKKILCTVVAALMLLFACIAAACGGGGDSPSESNEEGAATQNTQTFVNTVGQIEKEVTLSSGARIEVALMVYELLNDSEKKNADVIECKTLLDGYKTKYDVLKAKAEQEEAERLQAQLAAQFTEEVEKLPNIGRLTLDDRALVDRIQTIYDQLGEAAKSKAEVVTAHGIFMQAMEKITELEEAAHEEEIRAAAQEFIDAVDEIEEVTLEFGNTLENLMYDYEDFTDEVKEYAGVAEAKSKLDEYYAEYVIIRDENDVEEFIRLANLLNPAESVTLDSERAILNAEAAYREMSETAKTAEGVEAALQIVQKARAKYDELFAIAERARIDRFIELANNVRTDVENVDILWYDALYAASNAYSALTYESQVLPEVEEAFDRWNTAQKAFDKKGYRQIPMKDPIIVYSGDSPPHLVLQNDATMFNPIKEFFGVNSLAEVGQYAIMWLNVYVDGVFVGRGEINMASDFTGGEHIVKNSAVQRVLRTLAADHAEVVNGRTFGFSIHFEDREGKYIPSLQTKISADKGYTW